MKPFELPPYAPTLIESTRAIGYSLEAAVADIIDNSIDKPYIKMSKKVYEAIFKLKKFNYQNIYSKSLTKDEYD